MAKQDKTKIIRGKKKKWVPIHAPDMFENRVVGHTLQYETEDAIGTTIQVNLMNLTNNIKNQNVNVKFLITDVKDDRLNTKIIQYAVISSSIKRVIRRRHNRLDDSLTLLSKDGVKLRIKPIAITRNKAKGSVKSAMRAKMRELVIEFTQNNDYDTIFKDVVFHKIQKTMRDILNKIYPIKECDIRVLKHDTSVNKLKEGLVDTTPKSKKSKAKKTEEEVVAPAEEVHESEKSEEN